MDESMSESAEKAISALEKAGVGFVLLRHPAANTMELCRGIGEEYGARHCKNLFLTNKRGTEFRLLLMDPEKPFRTSDVSRKLGVTRMSFASAEQLRAVTGLEEGSVSVMCVVNEPARASLAGGALHVVMDAALLSREMICVHPNDCRMTLVLRTEELLRFLASEGITPALVEI
ncbi:MAG: hypothetical protein J5586_06715 [Clostridia bacterium]|nr:hypothetical protein [Clostridia bacterium]